MRSRNLTLGLLVLALAGCTANENVNGEPDLEDADPDALTWVSPAANGTLVAGDPVDLVVSTGNTEAHAVRFEVDGQTVGTCDTWNETPADGGDCNDDTLWSHTVTLTAPGTHRLVASFDLPDGTRVTTERSVVVSATDPTGGATDPGAPSNEPDPVPAGTAAGDEPIGVSVQAIDAARGYLDRGHPWLSHNGDAEWKIAGQRVVLRPRGTTGNGRVEIGDVDDVAQCMADVGDSVRRYADLGYVSRATVVALSLALTGCDANPDDADGAAVGIMGMPASQCVAEWAASNGATISEDECRQRMSDSTDFAVMIAVLRLSRLERRHQGDPVELAAEYTSGALRASRSNRFHLLSKPGALDDFVEAYNAYRTWEEGGSGPARARPAAATVSQSFRDPCAHPGANAIRRPGPDGVFRGTDGDDVIIGTAGDDEIHGGGGHDVICGRGGRDHLYGDDGWDYIDGGGDNDYIDGGAGNDVQHGGAGSDEIHGGPDDDFIDGGILDDDLFGEAGNDVLIGGHGTDFLSGGANDDLLRGDTGRDTMLGGPGDDTVSFATTTPHGDSPTSGISVDFNARLAGPDDPTDGAYVTSMQNPPHDLTPYDLGHAVNGTPGDPTVGLESGDGQRELVSGIEHIVGSSFDDTITHSPGTMGVDVAGGLGNDSCDGHGCDANETATPDGPYVMLDDRPNEHGLVVLGGGGADHLSVRILSDAVLVQSDDTGVHIATPMGGPCGPDGSGASAVRCSLSGALRYVVANGGAGADHLRLDGRYPRDLTAHFNGGADGDELTGAGGVDVMFTGLTGHDTLRSNGGADALLSEGGSAHPEGDRLYAGRGDDQIVVDYICAGHHFRGGPGVDISGFRRTGNDAITAQLGGRIHDPSHIQHIDGHPLHGRAFNPAVCRADEGAWTRIGGDLEILETSNGDDHLFGDDGPNIFWAWGGNDEVYGFDGDDVLSGLDGDDDLYGGAGRDELLGGPGANDRLFAQDGTIDARLSCGPGGGHLASHDPGESAPDCN